MSQSNYITLALFAVIGLVFIIDFYLKKKNRKSNSTDVDFPKKKKKSSNILIISIVSVAVIIISFFSVNKYIYDGRFTAFDDEISLVFGPSILIDRFLKQVKKSNFQWGTANWFLDNESVEICKNDLFPILYKILEIDNKNKFALYHLGYMNYQLGFWNVYQISLGKMENENFLNEAEEYGEKLLEFYPKYWGGYKILMDVNNVHYKWNKKRLNAWLMRSYATEVINKIGTPKNNWEKYILFKVYQERAYSNQELGDYSAIYNDALYLSQIGEIFVDENKYLESKAFALQIGRTKFTYDGSWDPIDYKDYK